MRPFLLAVISLGAPLLQNQPIPKSIAVWHITDHYGQLVEYLRMNGIVPPPTQKYGLQVR